MSFQDIDNITEARASTFAYLDSDSDNILFPMETTNQLFDSVESLTKRLEALKKKETRYTLHGSTLSHYWRTKRIPQGLRMDKEPTLGRNNKAFCKKWCEVLNKCSLDLMLLIIEHVREDNTTTREEIIQVEKDIKTKFGAEQLKDIEQQTSALLDAYHKELLETKLYKYRRDTIDYKEDKVYKWLSGGEARRSYRKQGAHSFPTSGTTSEESGTEEGAASRPRFFGPRYPLRSKTKDLHDGEVRGTSGSRKPT